MSGTIPSRFHLRPLPVSRRKAAGKAALPKSGGAMTGTLSNANSAQVRNITVSTVDLTAGTSTLKTGDLYFVYE